MSDMNVTNSAISSTASTYQASSGKKTDVASKTSEKPAVAENTGAVYEKSAEEKKATYSVNRMSEEERASLVASLKADQENRMSQLTQLVNQMISGQANTFAKADDSMWKFLAEGKFTVDPATKAQAQADIAEDGYWGVKQTAQRMFDFASALAGDDEEKMKKMQAAMQKGFEMATGTWGRELPELCQDTMKAANQLFEDYYASKKAVATEA